MSEDRVNDRVPWLRIFVEGVVIVGSILLAFGIDAWWDLAQRDRETIEILVVLDAEFAEVEFLLDATLERNRTVIAAADSILDQLRSGDDRIETGLLGDLFRVPTANSTQGALSALISSGRLDLIPSRELQALLAGWSSILEDIHEDEASAERFVYEELLPNMSLVAEIAPVLYRRLREDDFDDINGVVTIPTTFHIINLIETRRYHSEAIIHERERRQIGETVDRIRREIQALTG